MVVAAILDDSDNKTFVSLQKVLSQGTVYSRLIVGLPHSNKFLVLCISRS